MAVEKHGGVNETDSAGVVLSFPPGVVVQLESARTKQGTKTAKGIFVVSTGPLQLKLQSVDTFTDVSSHYAEDFLYTISDFIVVLHTVSGRSTARNAFIPFDFSAVETPVDQSFKFETTDDHIFLALSTLFSSHSLEVPVQYS